MKKLILFIIWFFIFSWNIFASTSYTSTSWTTSCNDTPTSWDNDNSWHKWIPVTNDSDAAESGSFSCEEHWYWSGSWSWYQDQDNIYNCPDDRYASSIQCYDSSNNVQTCTEDWSGWTKYKVYCKLRDDTYPNSWDLSSNPTDDSYLKAINSKNITIYADENWWSPIVKIKWEFENYNNPGNYNSEKESDNDNNSSTLDQLETTENISLVDNNRNSNNFRDYPYNITEVCDEAGNCSTDVRIFNYNIYANDIDSWKSSISWENDLNSWEIAEAVWQRVLIKLRDTYNNIIVPVYESDWTTIVKKVWVQLDYTNDEFFLDQYKKSWDSAVKIMWITDSDYDFSLTNTSTTKENITTDKTENWDYSTYFKVYWPTKNNYSKAWGAFSLDNIIANIYNGSNIIDSTYTFASNINFNYKPIYYTNIVWDLKDYWFEEWISQNSIVYFTKDSNSTTNPNSDIYFEFGSWARLVSDKLTFKYDNAWTYYDISEWYWTNIESKTLFKNNQNSDNNYWLLTKLLLDLWEVINSLKEQYFSTHIKYTIDWEKVVYNSDIVWKDNYWNDNNTWPYTTEMWLKVLWNSHSKNQKDILLNQEQKDIHLLWTLYKSKLKEKTRKNIFRVINNISWGQWWDSNDIDDFRYDVWDNSNNGRKILNWKVLYFDLSSPVVENTIVTNWWLVTANKTIVIKWWDLYIKWNIEYNSTSDMLWIVVLTDNNWKWGNIFIDPSVTYIWAQIYADKAILSAIDGYDWSSIDDEISSSEILSVNTNQSQLNNQLFIKWQVFSENTIWGSRKDPPVCPYFDKDSCDIVKAQQYDLNYLRRYFTFDSNNDWLKDSIANGWKYYFNWAEQTSYDSSYNYIDYPVVIRYNPMVQITPPPLFD